MSIAKFSIAFSILLSVNVAAESLGAGGYCAPGSSRRLSRVTQYFAPVLSSYDDYRCRKMEGTCFYQRNGVDMIYSVGHGSTPVSQAECPNGWGARSNCLNPCKSVAADRRYHKIGEVLFFPRLRGQICRGKVHDGFVQVADVGSAIVGQDRFDFYWGGCSHLKGDSCIDGSPQFGSPEKLVHSLVGATYCRIEFPTERLQPILVSAPASTASAR